MRDCYYLFFNSSAEISNFSNPRYFSAHLSSQCRLLLLCEKVPDTCTLQLQCSMRNVLARKGKRKIVKFRGNSCTELDEKGIVFIRITAKWERISRDFFLFFFAKPLNVLRSAKSFERARRNIFSRTREEILDYVCMCEFIFWKSLSSSYRFKLNFSVRTFSTLSSRYPTREKNFLTSFNG